MDDTLKQNLFFKVEAKLEKTFNSLHNYSIDQKSLALKEIMESLWMLERLSPVMFKKVVKDIDENLMQVSQDISKVMDKFQSCTVNPQGLVVTYKDSTNKTLPLATLTQIREKFQSKRYFKGYYIQLAYLMKPENLLSVTLWFNKEQV